MANRAMGRNVSSVGMMEGAFFVGRTELLEWVNGLLAMSVAKVEECASGAIYCQIVDSCYPGTVKMAKVNWMGRSDHEYIPNYKILQAAFDRNNIEKHIDVDKLIRAKYQDNLEFLQWMKAMWDRHGTGVNDYDPVKAREGRPVPAWAKFGVAKQGIRGPVRARASPAEKENTSSNSEQTGAEKVAARRPGTSGGYTTGAPKAAPQRGAPARAGASVRAPAARPSPAAAQAREDVRGLQQQLEEVMQENAELQETNAGLEDERDYYWTKLRNVEVICQTNQAHSNPDLDVAGLIRQIEDILYSEKNEDAENAETSGHLETAAELSADHGVAVA